MPKIQRGNRRSSLKDYKDFLQSFDELDLSSFVEPFVELRQDYEKLWETRKPKPPKCYSVTYKSVPDVLYIAFGTKDKCKGEATKYFRDNFHPAFVGKGWKKLHTEARAIRQPSFDQYYMEKKIPIDALMTLGVRIPCCICGEGDFGSTELEYKQCFIVEGEGDLNIFTKGLLLCKRCHDKHLHD